MAFINQRIYTNRDVIGDGSKGDEGRQNGGPIRNSRRRLEGVSTGGNTQEGTSKETVGYLGEIIIVDSQG